MDGRAYDISVRLDSLARHVRTGEELSAEAWTQTARPHRVFPPSSEHHA